MAKTYAAQTGLFLSWVLVSSVWKTWEILTAGMKRREGLAASRWAETPVGQRKLLWG